MLNFRIVSLEGISTTWFRRWSQALRGVRMVMTSGINACYVGSTRLSPLPPPKYS